MSPTPVFWASIHSSEICALFIDNHAKVPQIVMGGFLPLFIASTKVPSQRETALLCVDRQSPDNGLKGMKRSEQRYPRVTIET